MVMVDWHIPLVCVCVCAGCHDTTQARTNQPGIGRISPKESSTRIPVQSQALQPSNLKSVHVCTSESEEGREGGRERERERERERPNI